MTGEKDKEPFLSRWSRRKLETKAEPKSSTPDGGSTLGAAANASSAAVQGGREPAPLPELPSLESLDGLKSEYKDFMHPQVDGELRQSALKKLFGDPHFNVMDGLDTYIDDYSIPDPIPEDMLRKMVQSSTLALFEETEEEKAARIAEVQPYPEAPPEELTQTNSPTPAVEATNSPAPFVPAEERKNS